MGLWEVDDSFRIFLQVYFILCGSFQPHKFLQEKKSCEIFNEDNGFCPPQTETTQYTATQVEF